MSTQPTLPQEQQPTETQLPVTCPHCGKGFWHKIGHVFKTIGVTAGEVAIDAAVTAASGGEPGVPR